jgi:nitrate/nitrite-specific signal transduction histidine kinase
MRTGHYGLIGMRERAQRIGADLIFDNAADGGAEVTLIVPTRKAYAREDTWRARARHWRSRFRPR